MVNLPTSHDCMNYFFFCIVSVEDIINVLRYIFKNLYLQGKEISHFYLAATCTEVVRDHL